MKEGLEAGDSKLLEFCSLLFYTLFFYYFETFLSKFAIYIYFYIFDFFNRVKYAAEKLKNM